MLKMGGFLGVVKALDYYYKSRTNKTIDKLTVNVVHAENAPRWTKALSYLHTLQSFQDAHRTDSDCT